MFTSILLSLPSNPIGLFLILAICVLGMTLLFYTKKTQWVVYALLIWFPLESLILMYAPIEYFGYIKYAPELMMYGYLLGVLIEAGRRGIAWKFFSPPMRWLTVFVGIALLSLLFNWYGVFDWVLGMRQIIRFVFMILAIVWMDYDKAILRTIIQLGAGMIALEVLFGCVQYLAGGTLDKYLFSTRTVAVGNAAILGGIEQFWTAGSRIFATMGRYDQLGSFVALGLIMLFPWIYQLRQSSQRFWYIVSVATGLGVLVLTASRASWIAVFVGIVTIGVVLRRDVRVVRGIISLVLFVGVYLVGFAVAHDNVLSITERSTQSLAERLLESVSIGAWRGSYEGYGRIFFIINTPRLVVAQYPVLGVGPGRYGGGAAAALLNTEMYDRLHMPFGIQNIYGQIDNNWMSLWGEVGTLGILAWGALFGSIVRMCIFVRQRTRGPWEMAIAEGVAGLTVGIAVIGFFGPYFEFRSLMFYYWTAVGILTLLWYREKRKMSFL
jgi:hypothetical protein